MKIIFYIFTIYPLRFAFLVLDIVFKAIPLKVLKLVPSFNVTRKNLSTDKDTVEKYFNDPLVFRSLTFKFGNEINNAQKFVNENIHNLKIPTLVLHGANDKIVPIKVNDKISQLDNVKFLKVENSKHEILNQDTRMFVLSEIHQWFKEQNIL